MLPSCMFKNQRIGYALTKFSVTTGEKWDSLTRNWCAFSKLRLCFSLKILQGRP